MALVFSKDHFEIRWTDMDKQMPKYLTVVGSWQLSRSLIIFPKFKNVSNSLSYEARYLISYPYMSATL